MIAAMEGSVRLRPEAQPEGRSSPIMEDASRRLKPRLPLRSGVLSLSKGRPSATRSPTDEGRFRKGDVLSLSKGCREFIRQAPSG